MGRRASDDGGNDGKYAMYYEQWFCVTNGYGFQLMGWGLMKERPQVSKALEEMFFCGSI